MTAAWTATVASGSGEGIAASRTTSTQASLLMVGGPNLLDGAIFRKPGAVVIHHCSRTGVQPRLGVQSQRPHRSQQPLTIKVLDRMLGLARQRIADCPQCGMAPSR